MNAELSAPLLASFRDRRTGLILFGCLTILLGGLCAMFVLTIVGQALAPAGVGPFRTIQAALPPAIMYGGLAVALVWTGIGSILARRWARALLLIFSWSVLIVGVMGLAFMAVLLPTIISSILSARPGGQAALPPGVARTAMVVALLFVSGFAVVIPGLWVLFYRSPHVKATCETRNSAPSWTDACPLPVLAFSLWLVGIYPFILLTVVAYRAVLPLFGWLLTGWAGALGYLILAVISTVAAWAIYKLDLRGWWLMVISSCVFSFSNFVTYSRHDLAEIYQLMGIPTSQIEQMQSLPFHFGNEMVWWTLIGLVLSLAYLVYIRRFFIDRPSNQ